MGDHTVEFSPPAWDTQHNKLIYPIAPPYQHFFARNPIINHFLPQTKRDDRGRVYICPQCDKPLIPNRGTKRRWHFCHFPGSGCSYLDAMLRAGGESFDHRFAKTVLFEALRQRRPVTILGAKCAAGHCPTINDSFSIQYLADDQVVMEREIMPKCRPDISILNNGHVRYIFEIYHSNRTLSERPDPWFEISAREILEKDRNGVLRDLDAITLRDMKHYLCGHCSEAPITRAIFAAPSCAREDDLADDEKLLSRQRLVQQEIINRICSRSSDLRALYLNMELNTVIANVITSITKDTPQKRDIIYYRTARAMIMHTIDHEEDGPLLPLLISNPNVIATVIRMDIVAAACRKGLLDEFHRVINFWKNQNWIEYLRLFNLPTGGYDLVKIISDADDIDVLLSAIHAGYHMKSDLLATALKFHRNGSIELLLSHRCPADDHCILEFLNSWTDLNLLDKLLKQCPRNINYSKYLHHAIQHQQENFIPYLRDRLIQQGWIKEFFEYFDDIELAQAIYQRHGVMSLDVYTIAIKYRRFEIINYFRESGKLRFGSLTVAPNIISNNLDGVAHSNTKIHSLLLEDLQCYELDPKILPEVITLVLSCYDKFIAEAPYPLRLVSQDRNWSQPYVFWRAEVRIDSDFNHLKAAILYFAQIPHVALIENLKPVAGASTRISEDLERIAPK